MKRISLSVVALAATAAVIGAAAPAKVAAEDEPRVRKSVVDLTAEEKRDYVDAVLALKKAKSP